MAQKIDRTLFNNWNERLFSSSEVCRSTILVMLRSQKISSNFNPTTKFVEEFLTINWLINR